MPSTKVRIQQPSLITKEYWAEAVNTFDTYPQPTERCGKWMFWVSREDVDFYWLLIQCNTECGNLTFGAKASTAKPNPHSKNPNKHVVMVYTYDSEDQADVMRVREQLRDIGIAWDIPYKTDKATYAGKYEVHGDKNISRYFA